MLRAAHRLPLAAAMVVTVSAACVPPPRMCSQESDCGAQASCVAGRCVAHGATAAIDNARRLLFAPVDVGYVRRGSSAYNEVIATLGRAGEPAVAFLRFDASVAPEANVLEAYVLLERVTNVDMDAAAVALHAARVVSAWDSRSLSWGRQPRVEEDGLPVTRVAPGAGPLVRLDVRELVERWRRRGHYDFGVALLADTESPTGVALALGPTDATRDGDPGFAQRGAIAPSSSLFEVRVPVSTPVGHPRDQLAGPRLELYVR
jgi:hypothetical protein